MARSDPNGSNPSEQAAVSLEDRPLTQVVAQGLREAILNGELRPGDRIKQDSVARQYGTSRIPVREALRELRSEGLVLIEPDVGARVAPLEASDVFETYLIREAIEPLAVREGVQHLTEDQLTEIRRLFEESEEHADTDHLGRYIELDRLFHAAIFRASGMGRLYRTIESLWNTTYQYRSVYAVALKGIEISHLEHRLLLDTLMRRASEDAARIHEVHVRHARAALLDHLEQPNEETGTPSGGVARQEEGTA